MGGISVLIAEERKTYKGLPVIHCFKEVKKLADLVEKVTKEKQEEADVVLTIDGVEIPMVPFVKDTLKNVVVGAVKALDGYEEGKEIRICVRG